ncbi:SWIM zinc finger family protein [Halorhabdus amylolytica]|uniref:SWIM zinc finger family protein n=1 Tax=Halorhabdus amylolytica TaxID=2559573 RepID=UPI001B7D8BFD|nr:SWIM zinc finger family protein [Halorhabdus amylolytica]
MSKHDSAALQTAATDRRTDLDDRDARALTECMSVLPKGGDVYTVVGENGGTYGVDLREERCTCPDHEYREARCKHIRRAEFATGERTIPSWADTGAIDEQLGDHVEATPQVAAADGGIIIASDDGEILEPDIKDDGRPDDCECGEWNTDADLPCFACYREGFETPASAEDGDI